MSGWDHQNGAPTRNLEELLDIFTLLMWLSEALKEANWVPSSAHLDGINRIAPTLRQLRHADGTLPRFHGGSAGITGRLDEALVRSGNSTVRDDGLAMGLLACPQVRAVSSWMQARRLRGALECACIHIGL